MTTALTFTVFGRAQTAGSKRSFPFRRPNGALGVRVTDDNPKGRAWKEAVASSARQAYDGPLLDGPLQLGLRFILPRPKGHFGVKGLRGSAPPYPAVKPDLLKMARAVEDALTGVLWRDDALIVAELLRKEYGEPARVEIVVQAAPIPPSNGHAVNGCELPEVADLFAELTTT